MQLVYIVFAALFSLAASKKWELDLDGQGRKFFDYFSFFTENDPTDGYVNYVDRKTAFSKGYVKETSDGELYIGCDMTHVASGRGRDSVRLQSHKKYNGGLFMLYLSHMPTGCGTWPAFWTTGDNWPNEGEIDIIEGVDLNTIGLSTLHTLEGCDYTGAPDNFTGFASNQRNCFYQLNGNAGCSISPRNSKSYGAPFNDAKGGLYAMEWTQTGIRVWFWNEGSIPGNALSSDPNPESWGLPFGSWPFGKHCDSGLFKDNRVIFDLTFCGQWDGALFPGNCPDLGECTAYVRDNPHKFAEAYWMIHWLKVFQ